MLDQATEARPEYVNYPDAERMTGLSRVTLWKHVKAGDIEASHVGRAVRLNVESLRAFMKARVAA
jgi:predicted DNA-binding transcriptional regulator AlpA